MSVLVKKNVLVIGGGVIGLTTACVLADHHNVKIIASKFGLMTESVKATAIWHVYLVPETPVVLSWAERTLKKILELHATAPEAGIELIAGIELFRKQPKKVPIWSAIPPFFEILSEEEIAGYNNHLDSDHQNSDVALCAEWPVTWGYRIRAPVTSMARYLSWLESKCVQGGVKFQLGTIDRLATVADEYDVVVNCSGLGARDLVGDTGFVPYKGQYFVVSGDCSAPIDYVGDDDFPSGMAYVITRGGEVLVGGSAEEGVEDFVATASWDAVVRRAGVYVPWLRSQPREDTSRRLVVCIRPARVDGVRLELDQMTTGVVIHNYGHGGSGFSLSWGCAEDVLRMIDTYNT